MKLKPMAAEFGGQPVNELNLSHWRLGGYQDWEAQQDALEVVRRLNSDAAGISQAAPQAQLSQTVQTPNSPSKPPFAWPSASPSPCKRLLSPRRFHQGNRRQNPTGAEALLIEGVRHGTINEVGLSVIIHL